MKRILLLLTMLFLVLGCSSNDDTESPPPPPENIFEGNVLLTSQQEVNDFGAEQYTEITGILGINDGFNLEDQDIVSLAPLSTLTRTGNIRIDTSPLLLNLDGLNNITQTGSLHIIHCDNLESLSGLEGITAVGIDSSIDFKGLWIRFNPSLTSIEALQNTTTVHSINIAGNYSLTSLNGLENITEVTSDFINDFAGINIGGTIIDIPAEEPGNTSLADLCALQTLMSSPSFLPDSYTVNRNLYNPTIEDILSGNCNL